MPEKTIVQNFKRVLIISNFDLSSSNATDITMRSYFAEWPKEKLLILTTTTNAQSFARKLILSSSFDKKIRSFFSKVLLYTKGQKSNRNVIPGAVLKDESIKLNLKEKLFAIGAAYFDLFQLKLNSDIRKKIDVFNPQMIYTIMGSIKINKLAISTSKYYNIPIVPHFMDDWISTKYTGNVWLKYPRTILLKSVENILKQTPLGFCISKKMCVEYEARYNHIFFPLMNIVNIDNISKVNVAREPIRFKYFGGLHLNRWNTLMILSETLSNISLKLNLHIILEIYTSDENKKNYIENFKSENVIFKPALSHSEALNKMTSAHFLVHVESFEKEIIKFISLSISTKIPEYLASGVPIIAIGPPNIASIEYLQDNNCAFVSSTIDSNQIEETLLNAISNNKETVINNSKKLLQENHSIKQLEQFYFHLNNI